MGKKDKGNNDAPRDTTMWMVTFGDLLMLLLTFFVMLLTMKSMDDKALKSVFSIFEGGVGVTEFSSLSSVKPVSDTDNVAGLNQAIVTVMQSLHSRLDALLALNEKKDVASQDVLEEIMGGDGRVDSGIDLDTLEGFVGISEDERGVIITLESRAMFETGKAEIKPDMYLLLDAIVKILELSTNEILVMGHTDDRPLRGGMFRSNWELSLYRALNVHKYLVERKGLPSERLFAGGYGDMMPRFSNENSEGRGKNRRVEIVLRKT